MIWLYLFTVGFVAVAIAMVAVPLMYIGKARTRLLARLEQALNALQRLVGGTIRSAPYPTPPGLDFELWGRPAHVTFTGMWPRSGRRRQDHPHTWISLRVTDLANPLPLLIDAGPSRLLRRLWKSARVLVGDPDFDARFAVVSSDPQRTMLLPRRRHARRSCG